MLRILKLAAALPMLIGAATVSAHDHSIEKNGQILANGANHPRFVNVDGEFISCEVYGPITNDTIGAAWYGLETAHHGADATGGGKSDGCYMIEGGLSPLNPIADRNPAIK